MSDRASTMKCFDAKLETFLKTELGSDITVSFLYCNAHFLLGLSSSCDKAFSSLEKKICENTGEKLGRDKDKAFGRFGDGETATNRLIRTLCDIVGSKGGGRFKKKWL